MKLSNPGGGLSLAAADARYVLKAAGSFTGLTGAGFRDTNSGAGFDVTLGFTSSVELTAGRALTIDVGNVAHTIALGTTAGTITFPNAAAVTVAGLQIANVFTAAQTFAAGSVAAPSITFAGDTNTGFYDFANGAVAFSSNGVAIVAIDTYFALKSTTPLAWSVGDPAAVGVDTHLWRRGAANLGMGLADGAPAAQTFGGAQGSGTNITGGVFNIGTRGTGTGTGGIINFQSHASGASGSTLGTLVTVMQITSTTEITVSDAVNFVLNATTGTKWGTATSQKQSFWNATPVAQPAHIADPAGGAIIDAEARTAINSILAWQATLGLTAAA